MARGGEKKREADMLAVAYLLLCFVACVASESSPVYLFVFYFQSAPLCRLGCSDSCFPFGLDMCVCVLALAISTRSLLAF